MKLKCNMCDHAYEGTISLDENGWYSVCPNCGCTFPVAVSKGRIEMMFTNPDVNVDDSYEHFYGEFPAKVHSYFVFDTIRSFLQKWAEIVTGDFTEGGMWCWIYDNKTVWADGSRSRSLVMSGGFDYDSIEIFSSHWNISIEKLEKRFVIPVPKWKIWFTRYNDDGSVRGGGVLPYEYKHKRSAVRRAKQHFRHDPHFKWVVSIQNPARAVNSGA